MATKTETYWANMIVSSRWPAEIGTWIGKTSVTPTLYTSEAKANAKGRGEVDNWRKRIVKAVEVTLTYEMPELFEVDDIEE